MNIDALKQQLRGKLVVSCQTFEGEPIHGEGIVVKMAQCAKWADAAGIRANEPKNVADIKAADISTFEEGVNAIAWGADFVGTTLSGYTEHSKKTDGPNFDLIEKLCERFKDKVIAEGKVNCPEEAVRCIKSGALCVVVGGAITRPHLTAQRFVSFLKEVQEDE